MSKMKVVSKLKCSICGDEIRPHPLSGWAGGNNAQPVNDGRCCDACDALVVIPKRIHILMEMRRKDEVEK
jgi:hypothetical protein